MFHLIRRQQKQASKPATSSLILTASPSKKRRNSKYRRNEKTGQRSRNHRPARRQKARRLPPSSKKDLRRTIRRKRKRAASEKLGITVQNLTEDLAKRFGFVGQKGVLVTDVESGSPAAMAGIQPGSLIQEVNRKPIENIKEFKEEVEAAAKEGKIMFASDTKKAAFSSS